LAYLTFFALANSALVKVDLFAKLALALKFHKAKLARFPLQTLPQSLSFSLKLQWFGHYF
jgi:hypothetical protein